ncbi:allophanate hydrolase [Polymorphum gilvum]|nr:allophanate hydrolase [Polymorphum gilvum]
MPKTAIAALHEAYASGLTPEDMVDRILDRIAALDDPGIFLHVAGRDDLLDQFAAIGARDLTLKPLWGVPFAVKDNIDVAGMPTTAACPDYLYHPAEDATVVARLKAAGAIVVGKTNLDQFATGLVGVRSPYPIPRNAVDPALVPGGSSSGSAVAVAQGIVTFSLGTDTAGSGRVPAALNDLVGLKPSLGSLSATGVVPACRTLDTVSIFAHTVEDAYAAFAVAAAHDPADAYSRHRPAGPLAAWPARLAVGVPRADQRRFFGDAVQADSYTATLADIAARGAEIVEIDFEPFYETAALLYEGAWVAERYAAIRTIMETRPEILHPTTRLIIGGAAKLSAADAFAGLYRLEALKRQVEPVLAALDCLCVPTIPCFVSLDEIAADPVTPNSRLGTYTNFVNLLDLCGIAVPVARRRDGRPGNVTLLAAAGRDGFLAGLARAIARDPRHPDAAAPVTLAVAGAHMRGMPLNGQLEALGARFLAEATTAPDYRLYALAGQDVPKPGLLRVGPGAGAAIALELWQLTPAAFGAFVAALPAPMAIGTLRLADGRAVKGFLVEAEATRGTDDITEFGGWRAFVDRLAPTDR